MTALVLGTPRSGKSRQAESLAESLSGGGKKLYIATMIPFGEEGRKRVIKHRYARRGKGFITVECPIRVDRLIYDIADISESTCLLECMSNLIANEMHEAENESMSDKLLSEHITASVMRLSESAANLVIVSNTFPLEDEGYDEDTKRYVRLVEMINADLIASADRVVTPKEGEWI